MLTWILIAKERGVQADKCREDYRIRMNHYVDNDVTESDDDLKPTWVVLNQIMCASAA